MLNNPVNIIKTGGLQSPDIGNTVLGNLPSIPLISTRNYFLQAMESWVSTPNMSTQWIVLFEDFPQMLKQNVIQELEGTSGDKAGWNIDISKKVLCSYFLQKTIGCIFAQSVSTPRESSAISYTNPYKGFIGSPIMDNRLPFEMLNMSFLETNMSFVDSVIRPWSILVSHKGLVARPKEESVKTNIVVLQYSRTSQFLAQIPRKIWTYYDCAPVAVPQSEYNYTDEKIEIKPTINFCYNKYQVYYTTYIPIPDLIDKFLHGGVKELLGTVTVGKSIKKIAKIGSIF